MTITDFMFMPNLNRCINFYIDYIDQIKDLEVIKKRCISLDIYDDPFHNVDSDISGLQEMVRVLVTEIDKFTSEPEYRIQKLLGFVEVNGVRIEL